MRVMLDTDTCIFARKRPDGFKPRLPLHECGISIIVIGELEWGVVQSRRVEENRAALRALLDAVQVVDVDAEVAREYDQPRARLLIESPMPAIPRRGEAAEFEQPLRRSAPIALCCA